jgi:hypothetical protein
MHCVLIARVLLVYHPAASRGMPTVDNNMRESPTDDRSAAAPHVPLVRTEGQRYANGAVWTVDLLLREPLLLREHRNEIARKTEAAFGLGASLYFYVGHACPDFARGGDPFVFVFAADVFDGAPGTMTHFDTGGLYSNKIHLNRDVDLADYVAAHRLDNLDGWRDRFGAYLKEYFSSAEAYVLGKDRAKKPDDYGRLHHPENERRAWTWELQLHDDHDVRRGLLWLWVTTDVYDRLLDAIIDLRDDTERTRWQGIVEVSLRNPGASREASELCQAAEREIVQWL